MNEPTLLDKTYSIIINQMVKTGQAPHFTDIAAKLEIPMEEGRRAMNEVIAAGVPGCWQFPRTDYISSFAPFSNLPTQYRISIEGQQRWFGQ